MKVEVERVDDLVSISFSEHVYVSAHHTTALVLSESEYGLLERAISDLAEKEAAETADYEEVCPTCEGMGCADCMSEDDWRKDR